MKTGASFGEAVFVALGSLRGSKMRSFLTLLGIILATATLIAVMSIIRGMDVYIAEHVSMMGADGFRVTRIVMMQWDPKKFAEMLRRNPALNREEFEFLKSHAKLTMGFWSEIVASRKTSSANPFSFCVGTPTLTEDLSFATSGWVPPMTLTLVSYWAPPSYVTFAVMVLPPGASMTSAAKYLPFTWAR